MTIQTNCLVISADGEETELCPGDHWPLPYRGAKFTVKTVDGHLRVNWTRYNHIISTSASNSPDDLIFGLRELGKHSGSFVITAHKEILTKIEDENEDWIPYYVGNYDDSIEFDDVELGPTTLERGMYWTGLPFKSGETWFISPRDGAENQLMWRKRGVTFGSFSRYPALFKTYLDIRPNGGRLYFTPSGHVWINLKDDEVSTQYAAEFRDKQQMQLNQLQNNGNDVILRLIYMRVAATHGYRPVYLGHVSEFDKGDPPRTSFSSSYRGFGDGGENSSDEALFDDEGWSRR